MVFTGGRLMLKHIGGRKAAAAITVLVIGIVSVALKGDIPPGLLQLLEVVFGAFVVGNVGAKVIGVSRAKVEAKAIETVEPDNSEELRNIASGLITVQQLLQLMIRRTGIDKLPEPPQS
jgi:hypothetical protein